MPTLCCLDGVRNRKLIKLLRLENTFQSSGVSVLFSIDATNLHQIEPLSTALWDCVVFNFPHVGGKSNIKKNRKLLRDFFTSASKIISPEGKVMVTLCKGQGGTGQDQPLRAWHDSWQVVAMASFAGLILNEILPFNIDDYPVYSSTGYRSQDKGFHTRNALTHIFIKSSPLDPQPSQVNLNPRPVQVEHRHFHCSSYVGRHLRRQLHGMKNHPISIVSERIIHDLQLNWNDLVICESDAYPSHMKIGSKVEELRSNLSKLSTSSAEKSKCEENQASISATDCLFELKPAKSSDNSLKNKNSATHTESGVYVLRESLLHHVGDLIELASDHKAALTGDVYQRCHINDEYLPVKHELLLVVSFRETMQGVLEYPADSSFKECVTSILKILPFETTFEVGKNERDKPPDLCQILSMQSFKVMNYGSIKASVGCIGKAFLVGKQNDSSTSFVILLHLDSIACLLYSIYNHRQLWTRDERFTKQFQRGVEIMCFKPYSLYNVSHTHDISFWTSPDFTEQSFCDLVRDIADDYVTNLKLIDTYSDDSGRISLCYRLVFASCDQAFSYDDSYEFYQIIRQCLPTKMNVVLR